MDDATNFAQELHYSSRIRTHTVAISDEEALAKYEPRQRGSFALTPNRRLLELVSENSHGYFFPNPDAATLAKLFDELGEGVLYPPVRGWRSGVPRLWDTHSRSFHRNEN